MSIFNGQKFLFKKPESADEGAGSILQLDQPPYYTGRVLKFNTEDDYAAFVIADRNYPISKINGYRMVIQFAGSLDALPPDYDQMQAQHVMDEMAEYFYETKIETKPKGFERWLINLTPVK